MDRHANVAEIMLLGIAALRANSKLAVPMHYGFVVGSPTDAETFRREAEPGTVEVLTPVNPFERD